jgi:nucleotide-binding universal stress UspA family protein
MIKSVAWATDDSPPARHALTLAKDLARAHGAALLVLHVQEMWITRGGLLADSNDQIHVAALKRLVTQLREEGFDAELATGRATDGNVHQVILDLAEEAGIDVIVVGNHGHGPLAGLMLGSVALRLLQAARFPVLLVPSSTQLPG